MRMILLIQTQFGYCSPVDMDFYTFKYPQFKQQWWQNYGNVFDQTLASPNNGEIHQMLHQQNIIIVGNNQIYIDLVIKKFNIVINVYQQLIPILIPELATMSEYFAALNAIDIGENDIIIVSMYNCERKNKIYNSKQFQDNTNSFYRGTHQLPFSKIQSIQQIQENFKGYQNLFKQYASNPLDYYSFNLQKILINNVLLLTSSTDTTSSLQFNSLQFCYLSPNYLPQTSLTSCFLSVPIGMGIRGINGTGNLINGFEFILKFQSILRATKLPLYQIFSTLKDSIALKKQFRYQREGFGNGITDHLAISQVVQNYNYNQTQKYLDVITAGNLSPGTKIQLVTFQVLKIYVTIRGLEDHFKPLYENTAETNLMNNQEELAKYEKLQIYICINISNRFVPHYVGQIEGKLCFGCRLKKNLNRVEQQIKDNIKTDFKFKLSLQIIGNKINIELNTISDLSIVTTNQIQYFKTNGSFLYSACIRDGIITWEQLQINLIGDNVVGIQMQTGQFCNLYFCAKEQTKLNIMNNICAKSEGFTINKYYQVSILYSGIVIGCLFITMYLVISIISNHYFKFNFE